MASKVISTILNLKDNFSDTIQNVAKNTQSFRNGMKNTEEQAISMRDKVKGAYDTISQSVLRGIGFGAGMDIWDTMKEGIVETVTFSSELQKSLNSIQSATGIADKEISNMKDTMLDIYNSNFGENFEDIGEAIKTISQQTGASGEDLKDLTENALALRDTFGYDVNESLRSVNTLIKQFGIDGNEAFNLIAQGKQNGLDFSGEMLDSINEYSVQFKKLGFSAEDMFEILNNGSTDGAFNLDKVGDAIKEFSIRAIDGSDTTIDGFTKLGFNADDMAKKFAEGGDAAKEAFRQVTKSIGNMNDPVQQSIVGVDLFGTMWEDLGPKVVTQLGDMGDNFSATSDALNQIKKINFNDLGSAFQYIKRNIQTSILVPIGDEVLPRLNNFANWFKSNIPSIKENIGSITDTFLNIGGSIAETVFPSISDLASAIGDLVSTIYNSLVPAFSSVTPDSWNSVSDAIAGIVNKATDVVGFINSNWTTIEPIIKGITTAVIAWKVAIIGINTWTKIVSITTAAWETIQLMIWGIKNATTAWEAAQWLLNVAMSANPIGVVTIAIAGLGFAIYEIIKHWENIWGWIKKVWEVIDNNPILKFISFVINPLGSALMELITHWDDVVGAIKNAWNWLTGWIDKWNNTELKDKNVNINTNKKVTTYTDNGNKAKSKIPMNATGTHYWPGGPTRMNEYGDGEMAILPSGSKVIPAGQTDKILNGTNGINVNVVIQGNVIGNESFINQVGAAVWNKVNLALLNS